LIATEYTVATKRRDIADIVGCA